MGNMVFVLIACLLSVVLVAGQAPLPAPLAASLFSNLAPAPAPAPVPTLGQRQNGTCAFIYTSPRFYRVEAEVTLQGVRNNETLLSDALIRLLRFELQVANCQLSLSQGTNCTSGTQQLPCSDPVFNCGQGIVISEDVYEAVINEDCVNPAANNTLVCNTVAANPAITTAVKAGSCRPSCISGTAQATQEFPIACTSYMAYVATPTKDAANAAAAALGNSTIQNSVNSRLVNYTTGAGIQFLVVNTKITPAVGFGFFPPPPPPMMPILTPNASTNATATALAASGVLVYGPWSNCIPSCGEGVSTRTASCFAPDGTLLPLQACPGGINAQTSQPCSNSCPESYLQYSSWAPCNATCGGGITTRKATCTSSNGARCDELQAESTTKACNTAPCVSYTWAVSAWSECSALCGGGNRTRTVICVDSTGAEVSNNQCPGKKPRSSEKCNIDSCDFCADNSCLGRGTCLNGACICDQDYTGAYCEIPSACASKVVDAFLACCSSGLINVRGECCPAGTRLDADGECCSQAIDVCGVCGGNGAFMDMQGSCCSVADANGICCPSGLVDECGVCDGTGTSCNIEIAAQIKVPGNLITTGGVLDAPLSQYFQGAASIMGIPPENVVVSSITTTPPQLRRRRSLLQNAPAAAPAVAPQQDQTVWATVTVSPSVNGTGNTPFSSSYMAAGLSEAAAVSSNATATGIQIQSEPLPGRVGVCGNGICEIGERSTVGAFDGSCPQDCFMSAVACIGGCGVGGNCLPATGVCQCYVGYQGPNCDACAPGFIKTGGVCITSVTALDLLDASVIGSDGEALVTGMPSDGTSVGIIVGATVGAVVGLALLVLGFCLLRRCLQKKYSQDEHDEKDLDKPYGAIAGVDEEIGLRQRYGVSARGQPNSGRTYNVHVDVSGSANVSARTGDGWHSARESARSGQGQSARGAPVDVASFPHLYSQSLHVPQREAQAAFMRPEFVPQNQYRSSFRPAQPQQPPPQQYFYESSPEIGPDSGRLSSRLHSARESIPAPMPSQPDDVRASMQSASSSRSHASNTSNSVSAAVSLALSSIDRPYSAARSTPEGATEPPSAKVFFNPAYSMEGKSQHLRTTIAPVNANPSSAIAGPTSNPSSARSLPNGENIQERRAKLDALRAAVKALEQQARKGGPPVPQQSFSGGGGGGAAAAAQEQEKKFLPGRPVVPRLALNTMNSANAAAPRPGRVGPARQNSMQGADLIKAHPGPAAAAAVPQQQQVKRSSPGAAIARGAKTMLKPFRKTPEKSAAAPLGGGSTRPAPTSDYNDVMAKVEGALQRSAGSTPSNSARGERVSARGGAGSARDRPLSNRIPQPQPMWR